MPYTGGQFVRIPEFQRPLKWTAEDVRDLFDSSGNALTIASVLALLSLAALRDLEHVGTPLCILFGLGAACVGAGGRGHERPR